MTGTPTPVRIALLGNPNCGKTTLFNALTGLRQKVGNYPGVTVERRVGERTVAGRRLSFVDLPGTYSLAGSSPDERIAIDALVGDSPPDVVLSVVDASNLARNLYLSTQSLELGRPVVIALTMMDVANKENCAPEVDALMRAFGVPVIPIDARTGAGIDELDRTLVEAAHDAAPRSLPIFDGVVVDALDALTEGDRSRAVALRDLLDGESSRDDVHSARENLIAGGVDPVRLEAESRYAFIDRHLDEFAPDRHRDRRATASDRLDSIVLHRVFGPLVFVGAMFLMFQGVFSWAAWPTERLEEVFAFGAGAVSDLLGSGTLHDLVVDGILAGVLNVLVFVPQIMVLFCFIAVLEDSGYMARAVVLVDRVMQRVGLHGRSFVPMLSSFACAIPGIMATRTIENRPTRLVTMLIAPLMSCSARLPVYTLLIAAFFANRSWGGLSAGAIVITSMYLLGILAAFAMAYCFRKTILKGAAPTLILELPPYRAPRVGTVLRHVVERAALFCKRAGTVILAITVVIWVLEKYPTDPDAAKKAESERATAEATLSDEPLDIELARIDRAESSAHLRSSLAGRLGRGVEPVLAPLGFDWRIGIGVVSSFAAREVLVSTLGTVFRAEAGDEEEFVALRRTLADDPAYRPLTGISLMVFFVLACQCMSTIAVLRRETATWRWPVFLFVYMTALAWVASFLVWQVGSALGY